MRRAAVLAAVLAVAIGGCGRFAPAGEQRAAETETAEVGSGVAVPTTVPPVPPAPGESPAPPNAGENFRTVTRDGLELTIAAGPEEGGDGLILQLTFKNVSDRTQYHDPNQQVLFEIVRPDGKGFRWTDSACRAAGPREGTTGGPVAIQPGEEGKFLARYPTARQTRASSAPPECYLPAGDYVLRGLLDSCPESAWTTSGDDQPLCARDRVVPVSAEMPIHFD